MGSLRRTESYLVLPVLLPSPPIHDTTPSTVPYQRSLQFYKDQRQRRKSILNRTATEPITIRTRLEIAHSQPTRAYNPQQRQPSLKNPTRSSRRITAQAQAQQLSQKQVSLPTDLPKSPVSTLVPAPPSSSPTVCHASTSSAPFPPRWRPSSPLAPPRNTPLYSFLSSPTHHPKFSCPAPPPVRPRARVRGEPDLYRTALLTRMKESPDGQRILRMGARLAVEVMSATLELERLIGERGGSMGDTDMDRDTEWSMPEKQTKLKREAAVLDVEMTDASVSSNPTLSSSWIVVGGDDWEMVDSTAR